MDTKLDQEVLRCRELLEALSRANLVRLQWVSGYSGVIGNEKVDRLANKEAKGIKARRCGVGLPGCYLEERLEELLGKMTPLRWQEEKGMRQTKLLIRSSQTKPG